MPNGHEPIRLLHEQYMPLAAHFRIFRQVLDAPIAVHWHDFFELALIVGGSGVHVLNGARTAIGRGSVFLLTPADFHEIAPDPGGTLTLYNLIFTEPFLRAELFQWMFQHPLGPYATQLNDRQLQTIAPEFERMWDESADPPPLHGDWIVRGALERVLIDLHRICMPRGEGAPYGSAAAPIHPAVRDAVLHIQHHFREPLTLGGVARHVGLSLQHFSECFSKQVGIPFQSYVLERRLQFANALLRTTALPVTEIGFAAGFNTLNHFERSFKRRFSVTPRQARK